LRWLETSVDRDDPAGPSDGLRGEREQLKRLFVGEVMQYPKQKDSIDRGQFPGLGRTEDPHMKRGSAAPAFSCPIDVSRFGVESVVVQRHWQSIQVIRRSAAHVRNRVPRGQIELVDTYVAQLVGPYDSLESDVGPPSSEHALQIQHEMQSATIDR
jgi:hypothetical protein